MKARTNRNNYDHNPYKDLFNPLNLRPIEVVIELMSKEKDLVLFKKLRYEKRLIYLDWFWTNAIDFETFKKLIKGDIILFNFI